MHHPTLLPSLILFLLPPTGPAQSPTSRPASRPAATVTRVGGDQTARAVPVPGGEDGTAWSCGRLRIDTPLPVGYPAPTPPEALELKVYPTVRRAQVRGQGPTQDGLNGAFWPLFQHIQERRIAMTAPVEVDLLARPAEAPREQWVMAFLYRERDQGPTGAAGKVDVVDQTPRTVLALGMTERWDETAVAEALAELRAWLAGQSAWQADGAPRLLFYHGPQTPAARQWWEVQLPVRAAR